MQTRASLGTLYLQESRNMADNKGGSDLDVFEGLTKKPAGRPSFPPPGGPGSAKTGSTASLPPASGMPPGPPPRERPKTMLGIAPPPVALPPPASAPSLSKGGSLPPPLNPPGRGSTMLMNTVPVGAPAGGSLPPPGPPSLRGGGPLPPLSRPPGAPGLPPVTSPPTKPVAGNTPKSAKGAGVDMDWDDEDEKTNIYDKEETAKDLAQISKPMPAAGAPARPNLGAAAALAAGSGGQAGPASIPAPLPRPAPVPLPPPAPLPASGPGPNPLGTTGGAIASAQPSRMDSTQLVRNPAPSRGGLFVAIGLGAVALAAIGFFAMPKKGTLLVSVKSGGRNVDTAQVLIGDRVVCDKMPCRIPDLPKGNVSVKATAPGYDPGDQFATVLAGEEAIVNIELPRSRDLAAEAAAAAAAAKAATPVGTGFKATGPAYVKVALDGKDLGPLPQEVKDATPGDHKVKFYSTDRYQADERTVSVKDGVLQDLGPIKLKVLKGKASLTLETTGARVTLVSGSDRKSIPVFPISVDIDTSKQWVIEATKTGFDDFKLPISFDDGEAEKTFAIALNEKGKKPVPKPDDKNPTAKVDPKVDDKKATPPDSGTATLNINSIPPSSCVLDGRPIGPTPKAGVSVPAGTHTVMFVHPEKGKKSQTVTVKGGETKSVNVRF
jgi:serine/threonine-protein kinase